MAKVRITEKTLLNAGLTKAELALAKNLGIKIIPQCRDERGNLDALFESKKDANKAVSAAVARIKKAIAKFLVIYKTTADEWLSQRIKDDKRLKAEKARDQRFFDSLANACGRPLQEELEAGLRLGNKYDLSFVKRSENNLTVQEWIVFEDYGRKRYPRTMRRVEVSLKKGFYFKTIGGVLTFLRGKINRAGMACEWVEQGRAIADTKLVKGFLVKGEHIEASSLKEAQRINADHRAETLSQFVEQRKRAEKRAEKLRDIIVTFDDSLKSGNCRPGTENFVRRVEEVLGREVTELSADRVLYYGKRFGLYYYAKRAVDYAMRSNK